MKLSEYDKVVGTYKAYVSNFLICDLRSGHFRDIVGKWAKMNSVSCNSRMKIIEAILLM